MFGDGVLKPAVISIVTVSGLSVILSYYTALSILGAYFLSISTVGFFLFGIDKSAARARLPRITEGYFHFLAFFGATPGILLAMLVLRHKTRDQTFLPLFIFIFAVQLLALAIIREGLLNQYF